MLRQILGEYVDDDKERYNFKWNGKGRALRFSQTPSTGTLRPCKEESKNWEDTQNLYIEGDNLEVLKILQKSYHGKIKMIYIDPVYSMDSTALFFVSAIVREMINVCRNNTEYLNPKIPGDYIK